MQVVGEGAGLLPTGRRNRFVLSLLEGLADAGVDADDLGWRVRMDNHIPVSRGLGSSASATVAALVAADAFLDGALGQQRILELAVRAGGSRRQRRRRAARRPLRRRHGGERPPTGHPPRPATGPAGRPLHPRPSPVHRGHAGGAADERALRRCRPQRGRGGDGGGRARSRGAWTSSRRPPWTVSTSPTGLRPTRSCRSCWRPRAPRAPWVPASRVLAPRSSPSAEDPAAAATVAAAMEASGPGPGPDRSGPRPGGAG